MTDDITGAEPKVTNAAFADPYVLLLRDDLSIMVLKADESGDLDEIDQGKASRETKWVSGSLYEDSNDVLRLESDDDNDDEAGNVLMFLLNSHGGLEVGSNTTLSKLDLFQGAITEMGLGISASKFEQACLCGQWSQFSASVLIHRIYSSSFNRA
jgi:hypothetical protein